MVMKQSPLILSDPVTCYTPPFRIETLHPARKLANNTSALGPADIQPARLWVARHLAWLWKTEMQACIKKFCFHLAITNKWYIWSMSKKQGAGPHGQRQRLWICNSEHVEWADCEQTFIYLNGEFYHCCSQTATTFLSKWNATYQLLWQPKYVKCCRHVT